MMKKILSGVLVLALCLAMCGCAKEEPVVEEPDILQIRSICELATLECYYHNVAKSVKTKGTGLAAIGEKDREFWTEYTGVVKIGVDMSKVKMEISGTDVKITIPAAELLSAEVDESTYNADSSVFSEDSFFNSNKITVEDQQASIADAQAKMKEEVINNNTLLINAQNRAKMLIENYIKQLGAAIGVNYKISWVYLD